MSKASAKATVSLPNIKRLAGFYLYEVQNKGWQFFVSHVEKSCIQIERKGLDHQEEMPLNKLVLTKKLCQVYDIKFNVNPFFQLLDHFVCSSDIESSILFRIILSYGRKICDCKQMGGHVFVLHQRQAHSYLEYTLFASERSDFSLWIYFLWWSTKQSDVVSNCTSLNWMV